MNVFFRADASTRAGSGHVMRCLTLAEILRSKGADCTFICREHPGHLADLIREKGFDVCVLPVVVDRGEAEGEYADWLGDSWEHDASQSLSICDGADWLVVDHYALDHRWHKRLAPVVGHVMVIDDLANREYFCDVLLDQNLGKIKANYKAFVPEGCVCLMGPEYALLRNEFMVRRPQSLANKNQDMGIQRVLVSLGGSDQDNATEWVLDLLSKSALEDHTYLDIVMGASAPHLARIQEIVKSFRFHARVSVNVTNMAERMALANFSIGAAGSTAWERCCLGLPSAILVLAENQRKIAEQLQAFGASVLLDIKQPIKEASESLNALFANPKSLEEMGRRAAGICDGRGGERVVRKMLEIQGL